MATRIIKKEKEKIKICRDELEMLGNKWLQDEETFEECDATRREKSEKLR